MYVIEIYDITQDNTTLKFVLCLTFGVKNKPFGFYSQLDVLSQNQGVLHKHFIVHNVNEHFQSNF